MATILIVDDEPAFCDLLKWLLKSHGHEVLIAYNGQDAVDSYMQCRPHFTLLDLRMPEMDGLEVLKKIRTIDPKAAVMILTGWGTDELEKQARRFGATDFLSKKLSLDSIVASMERLLKPSDKATAPGPSSAEKVAVSVVPETNTILLIDNNPKTRDELAKFLKMHGFQVYAAQDGTTARLLVHQMLVGQVQQRGLIPWRLKFFTTGEAILPPAPLAPQLEYLDPVRQVRQIRRLDRARASRQPACNRFMLERFDKLLLADRLRHRHGWFYCTVRRTMAQIRLPLESLVHCAYDDAS